VKEVVWEGEGEGGSRDSKCLFSSSITYHRNQFDEQ
jgi:hypothetical protein